MSAQLETLDQLLDRICAAAQDSERVSLGRIMETVGNRSFGPLLLLAGIILFSPLSGIPGMPTLMAGFVLLVSGQLLFGRRHFWLPGKLLKRSITQRRLLKAVKWLRPVARFVDRWIRSRMHLLVGRAGMYVIAAICCIMALGVPAMEVVPFSATTAGAALTAFGLALIARDGLLALIALALTGGVVGLILRVLL
ncbi:MAG: exopolysaccharide biosynthesis protein [Thiogranum sp.]|nr:exopolysaccharide biosynthesis protein [Thiogranum sp.]